MIGLQGAIRESGHRQNLVSWV